MCVPVPACRHVPPYLVLLLLLAWSGGGSNVEERSWAEDVGEGRTTIFLGHEQLCEGQKLGLVSRMLTLCSLQTSCWSSLNSGIETMRPSFPWFTEITDTRFPPFWSSERTQGLFLMESHIAISWSCPQPLFKITLKPSAVTWAGSVLPMTVTLWQVAPCSLQWGATSALQFFGPREWDLRMGRGFDLWKELGPFIHSKKRRVTYCVNTGGKLVSMVERYGGKKGVELLLNEVEAESQATLAGDKVQSLVVTRGPVLGCLSGLVEL